MSFASQPWNVDSSLIQPLIWETDNIAFVFWLKKCGWTPTDKYNRNFLKPLQATSGIIWVSNDLHILSSKPGYVIQRVQRDMAGYFGFAKDKFIWGVSGE